MSNDEAVRKAMEFVQANSLPMREIRDVRYLGADRLAMMEGQCPADLLETYRSVRDTFRSHWVVTFEIPRVADQVTCPDSEIVCVYDSGEVALNST